MINPAYQIHERAPQGAVAVTEPYRQGDEDWMISRAILHLRAGGTPFVLVRERASRERGGFVGIAIYRLQPYVQPAPTPVQVQAPTETKPPAAAPVEKKGKK